MDPLGVVGSLAATVRDQVTAAARLPSATVQAVEELRDAARGMRRVADRIDAVLDDVEEPVRALAPGLRRLATLLDDPLVADAPETLARLRDEVLPALRGLRETQQRVASIAGSTDRISALIDETGGRLAALPGAAALLMRRSARTVEQSGAVRPLDPVERVEGVVPAEPAQPVTPPAGEPVAPEDRDDTGPTPPVP